MRTFYSQIGVTMDYFFPIFGLVIIFVIWFTYERKKHSTDAEKASKDFWLRDSEANSVRKVNLDTITYITIPVDSLPFGKSEDSQVKEYEHILLDLSDKRILNLTGKTSTDIKMLYGAANLDTVTEYDNNYTLMVQTIYNLGNRLNELNLTDDAISFLKFGIDSLTDISGNYKLLCELYLKTGQSEKLKSLKETALKLDSLSKKTILKYIDESQSSVL